MVFSKFFVCCREQRSVEVREIHKEIVREVFDQEELQKVSKYNLSHVMRKPVFRGLQAGKTQTSLLSYRD